MPPPDNSAEQCGMFPYSPRQNALHSVPWECFKEEWKFKEQGNGIIEFYAIGYDLYVAVFDSKWSTLYKYAIVIAGWGNQWTKIYKDGSLSNEIAAFKVGIPDITTPTHYKLEFNKNERKIKLFLNGKIVVDFQDKAWNAPFAQYYSFSQWQDWIVLMRGCK